jgi:hypothetical protein
VGTLSKVRVDMKVEMDTSMKWFQKCILGRELGALLLSDFRFSSSPLSSSSSSISSGPDPTHPTTTTIIPLPMPLGSPVDIHSTTSRVGMEDKDRGREGMAVVEVGVRGTEDLIIEKLMSSRPKFWTV